MKGSLVDRGGASGWRSFVRSSRAISVFDVDFCQCMVDGARACWYRHDYQTSISEQQQPPFAASSIALQLRNLKILRRGVGGNWIPFRFVRCATAHLAGYRAPPPPQCGGVRRTSHLASMDRVVYKGKGDGYVKRLGFELYGMALRGVAWRGVV